LGALVLEPELALLPELVLEPELELLLELVVLPLVLLGVGAAHASSSSGSPMAPTARPWPAIRMKRRRLNTSFACPVS
jgi:hypothetical protein